VSPPLLAGVLMLLMLAAWVTDAIGIHSVFVFEWVYGRNARRTGELGALPEESDGGPGASAEARPRGTPRPSPTSG